MLCVIGMQALIKFGDFKKIHQITKLKTLPKFPASYTVYLFAWWSLLPISE